jgi:hypothetical protein
MQCIVMANTQKQTKGQWFSKLTMKLQQALQFIHVSIAIVLGIKISCMGLFFLYQKVRFIIIGI